MIKIKNKKEIDLMREGGKILSHVVNDVVKKVKPGVTVGKLNELAEELIKTAGARPSFKGYKSSHDEKPFPTALCISINNEVVHGSPPSIRKINKGDVVGIDCGVEYRGMFTDMAKTVIVGRVDKKTSELVKTTEEALMKGIGQVKPGNKISDISQAIYNHLEQAGFFVVTQLTGHGVGHSVHEPPQIPNYIDSRFPDCKLEEGMTLAIEPMANLGCEEVETLNDGWTVATCDGSVSAHFEHTVAVTDRGVEILTK